MSSKITSFNFAVLIFSIALVLFNGAMAQPSPDALASIIYPVPELGNCKDEKDCSAYCDKPQNMSACISFAKKNNLMPSDEIAEAEKFLAAGGKGPGGCTTKEKCETYCNNINNMDECLAFAEKSGIMPAGEFEEAKKVQKALKAGAKLPGGCTSKAQCETFCNKSENMEECVTFAEAAGFMPENELQEAKKVLAAIKQGAKMPACSGRKACDEYCGDPSHMEECMDFAIKAGLMPPEEAQNAQKMLKAVKAGIKPPACRGKEECDAYCSSPEHEDECFKFAEAAGMISEEDKARMQEGMQKFSEGIKNAPAPVVDCLKNTIGAEVLDQITAGTKRPSRDLGDKMRVCFEEYFSSQGGPGGPGGMGGGGGPPPEIMKCLQEKGIDPSTMSPGSPPPAGAEECFKQFGPQQGSGGGSPPGAEGGFGPPPGMEGGASGMGEFTGPGGCKTPEECRAYCQSNPSECGNFGPPPQGSFTPPPGEGAPIPPPPDGTVPQGYPAPSGDVQYQQQYQQQYQEQYQQQYQQYQGQMPGTDGGALPPPGYTAPAPTDSSSQPPASEPPPPPPSETVAPSAYRGLQLLGNILMVLMGWQ